MAEVTLHVVVKSEQVDALQKKINELNGSKITLTVNETGVKNLNTRLLTMKTRAAEAAKEVGELEGRVKTSTQSFQSDTKAIQDNTEALNDNRTANERNSRTSRKVVVDHREHNEAVEKQGFLYKILGRSVGDFILRMTAYRAVYAGIRAITNGFVEALKTLKAVDDELVTVRKVTGFSPEQMADVEAQAYAVASRYGVAAEDYVSGVAAFARAGYKELSGELAELAQKTMIVGDTTAEVANQFLLSVDAAYKYEGSVAKLSAVLDGANELDNKYATSIEKIAEGMGIVAPVAAQMHVGIDELAASIGTITAVTQRSGSETARALRALFLNIVGDTKTEIDEGVTWTTGEIEGLRDVIKVYAKDAYDAAQATGSIIDPMKAMEGLSKSLKDGLLSEQELMQMVSDIGGKLRTSQLLALINNWDMYESMLNDYRNAAGSAEKEIENAMDSWSRKTEVLKNTWTEFIKTNLNSSMFKGFLDTLTSIVGGFDSLLGVVARLSLLVAAIKLPAIVTGLKNIGSSLAAIFSTVQTGASYLSAIQGLLGVVAVAWTAVSFAVEKYKDAQDEAIRAQRQATQQSAASITTSKDRMKQLMELQGQYKILSQSISTEEEADSALIKLKSDLASVYGKEEAAIAKVNDVRREGLALLDQENQQNLEQALALGAQGYQAAVRRRNGLNGSSSLTGGYIDIGLADIYASILGRYGVDYSLDTRGSDWLVGGRDQGNIFLTGDVETKIQQLTALINALQAQGFMSQAEKTVFGIASEELQRLTKELDAVNPVIDDYQELMAMSQLYMEGFGKAVITNADELENYKNHLKDTYGGTDEMLQIMLRLVDETYPQFTEQVEEATDAVEAETKSIFANQDALDANADSSKRLAAAKADAEAAARNLIPALFDEEGQLTDAGKAALEASGYLADLVNAEITLQNEIAMANYANIRAQLAAVSTDALRAAYAIIAAYEAAQTARNMGYSVGNLGYDREHLPEGTGAAVELLRQLQAAESALNSISVQASQVGTYGTGARPSSSGGGGGHGGGSSGSSSSSRQEDTRLTALQERVSLLRSELRLAQARGDSEERQAEIMRQIMQAIMDEANYLISIGASQETINDLMTDYYNTQNQLNELLEEEEDTTDHFLESLHERIALLESELEIARQSGDTQRQIELMEQIAAALEEERDYLISIGGDQIEINNLTAESLRYHNQISQLMEEEAESAARQADAVRDIQTAYYALQNAMSQRNVHIYNAETGQWEWAANPNAVQSARQNLLGAISSWYGAGGGMPFMDEHGNLLNNGYKGGVSNFGGTNNYGATYNIGGIQISEQDAKSMSLYQLLQLSKSLGIYTRTA